jgi:acetoacetyl-CoA synthetase
MSAPIWTPSPERIAEANLTAFIGAVNRRWGGAIVDYASLHAFSIAEPERFWRSVLEFCRVEHSGSADRVLIEDHRMSGARWFPDITLNVARTLLAGRDTDLAVIGLREDGRRNTLTFAELRALVSLLAQALRAAGIGIGDRVACFMPSVPETVAAMLATAAVGAIWASCPPEYGVVGALDRIEQIAPKLLFTADGYLYGGERHDLLAKAGAIAARVPSIENVVVVPVLSERPDVSSVRAGVALHDFLAPFGAGPIEYRDLPFDQPGYILFSSGTTGRPKCILHSAGGALLENLKAHALQFDVKPGDRVYMAATTGWVVWNIMSFALGCGAAIVLYDGSPFYPTKDALVRHAASERVTFLRLAARYVEAIAKARHVPMREHDLSALRTVMCNGSPFSAEGYEYIHTQVKRDVHLVSPSGGTDPFGSLVSANPIGPVWPGEIQAPALGLAIDVFDGQGRPLRGAAGELVVTRPFPSMPLGYLDDPGAARYREAYFAHYPNVWRHGDWAEITPRGGFIIHGRSDATLNARGVRIGTAEIYRQLESVPEIAESVAVAQDWDGDTRVVLFVRLQPGARLDAALRARVRAVIRDNLSPRHVPAKIVAVPAIPLTVTGKVSEVAVRDAIHGRPVRNRDVLANPDALAHFAPERLPEMSEAS